MYWSIWYGVSLTVLLGFALWAFVLSRLHYKNKGLFTPNKLLFFGIFSSSALLFGHVYYAHIENTSVPARIADSALLAAQHAIRLFAMDGGALEFADEYLFATGNMETAYFLLCAVLYLAAPLMTFGVILSFFKNISSYRRYLFFFGKNTYVFSELNEKTLALAKSINERDNLTEEG